MISYQQNITAQQTKLGIILIQYIRLLKRLNYHGQQNQLKDLATTLKKSEDILLPRCLIIRKDHKGYGLTVSGDNPVYVQSVRKEGAADKAGVREGDKIIKVNGKLVTHANHVEVVRLIKASSYVALTVLGGSSNTHLQQFPTSYNDNVNVNSSTSNTCINTNKNNFNLSEKDSSDFQILNNYLLRQKDQQGVRSQHLIQNRSGSQFLTTAPSGNVNGDYTSAFDGNCVRRAGGDTASPFLTPQIGPKHGGNARLLLSLNSNGNLTDNRINYNNNFNKNNDPNNNNGKAFQTTNSFTPIDDHITPKISSVINSTCQTFTSNRNGKDTTVNGILPTTRLSNTTTLLPKEPNLNNDTENVLNQNHSSVKDQISTLKKLYNQEAIIFQNLQKQYLYNPSYKLKQELNAVNQRLNSINENINSLLHNYSMSTTAAIYNPTHSLDLNCSDLRRGPTYMDNKLMESDHDMEMTNGLSQYQLRGNNKEQQNNMLDYDEQNNLIKQLHRRSTGSVSSLLDKSVPDKSARNSLHLSDQKCNKSNNSMTTFNGLGSLTVLNNIYSTREEEENAFIPNSKSFTEHSANIQQQISKPCKEFHSTEHQQHRSQAPSPSNFDHFYEPIIEHYRDIRNKNYNKILSLEEEDEDEMDHESIINKGNSGPFATFERLKASPAHLAIFLNYLCCNSDPNSLLFSLICDIYDRGRLKEHQLWAYEVHSSFIVPNAMLKISIPDSHIIQIDDVLMKSWTDEIAMKNIFRASNQHIQQDIEEKLSDFRLKRQLGLSSIYGDNPSLDKLLAPSNPLSDNNNNLTSNLTNNDELSRRVLSIRIAEQIYLQIVDKLIGFWREDVEFDGVTNTECLLLSAVLTLARCVLEPQSSINNMISKLEVPSIDDKCKHKNTASHHSNINTATKPFQSSSNLLSFVNNMPSLLPSFSSSTPYLLNGLSPPCSSVQNNSHPNHNNSFNNNTDIILLLVNKIPTFCDAREFEHLPIVYRRLDSTSVPINNNLRGQKNSSGASHNLPAKFIRFPSSSNFKRTSASNQPKMEDENSTSVDELVVRNGGVFLSRIEANIHPSQQECKVNKQHKSISRMGHTLTPCQYIRLTFCDRCHTILQGLRHQGYQCLDCQYNVHHTCIDDIDEYCPGNLTLPVTSSSNENNNNEILPKMRNNQQMHNIIQTGNKRRETKSMLFDNTQIFQTTQPSSEDTPANTFSITTPMTSNTSAIGSSTSSVFTNLARYRKSTADRLLPSFRRENTTTIEETTTIEPQTQTTTVTSSTTQKSGLLTKQNSFVSSTSTAAAAINMITTSSSHVNSSNISGNIIPQTFNKWFHYNSSSNNNNHNSGLVKNKNIKQMTTQPHQESIPVTTQQMQPVLRSESMKAKGETKYSKKENGGVPRSKSDIAPKAASTEQVAEITDLPKPVLIRPSKKSFDFTVFGASSSSKSTSIEEEPPNIESTISETKNMGLLSAQPNTAAPISTTAQSTATSSSITRYMEMLSSNTNRNNQTANASNNLFIISNLLMLQKEDPDLEIVPEIPNWQSVVDWDCLKRMKPKEVMRQDVINELFHTERNHVRNLKILDYIFYRPLKNDNLISTELLDALFPNLEQLIKIHSELNQKMKKLKEQDIIIESVGDLLKEFFEDGNGETFQEAVITFYKNQVFALEALKARQRKDAKLNAFLNDAESNPLCRRLHLKDLVPCEIQRLTKYPLLTDNIMKYTVPDTDEYKNLTTAYECSRSILANVNEAVRDNENHQRLLEIEAKLDTLPLEKAYEKAHNTTKLHEIRALKLSHKRLVMEGALTWRYAKNKTLDVHALLLDDCILLLQRQDDRYILKFQVMAPTSSYIVPPSSNLNALSASASKDETSSAPNLLSSSKLLSHSPVIKLNNVLTKNVATDKRAFFVVSTVAEGPQLYELVASTSNERKIWLTRIEKAIERLKVAHLRNSSSFMPSMPKPSGSNVGNNVTSAGANKKLSTSTALENTKTNSVDQFITTQTTENGDKTIILNPSVQSVYNRAGTPSRHSSDPICSAIAVATNENLNEQTNPPLLTTPATNNHEMNGTEDTYSPKTPTIHKSNSFAVAMVKRNDDEGEPQINPELESTNNNVQEQSFELIEYIKTPQIVQPYEVSIREPVRSDKARPILSLYEQLRRADSMLDSALVRKRSVISAILGMSLSSDQSLSAKNDGNDFMEIEDLIDGTENNNKQGDVQNKSDKMMTKDEKNVLMKTVNRETNSGLETEMDSLTLNASNTYGSPSPAHMNDTCKYILARALAQARKLEKCVLHLETVHGLPNPLMNKLEESYHDESLPQATKGNGPSSVTSVPIETSSMDVASLATNIIDNERINNQLLSPNTMTNGNNYDTLKSSLELNEMKDQLLIISTNINFELARLMKAFCNENNDTSQTLTNGDLGDDHTLGQNTVSMPQESPQITHTSSQITCPSLKPTETNSIINSAAATTQLCYDVNHKPLITNNTSIALQTKNKSSAITNNGIEQNQNEVVLIERSEVVPNTKLDNTELMINSTNISTSNDAKQPLSTPNNTNLPLDNESRAFGLSEVDPIPVKIATPLPFVIETIEEEETLCKEEYVEYKIVNSC